MTCVATVSGIAAISTRSAIIAGTTIAAILAGQRPRGAEVEIGSRVAAAVAVGDGIDECEGGGFVRIGHGAAGLVAVEQGQGQCGGVHRHVAFFAGGIGHFACPAVHFVAGQGVAGQCPRARGGGGSGHGGFAVFTGFLRGRHGVAIGIRLCGGHGHVMAGSAAAVSVVDHVHQCELWRGRGFGEIVAGGRLAALERNVADQLFGGAGIAALAAGFGLRSGVAGAGGGDAGEGVGAGADAVEIGKGRATAVAVDEEAIGAAGGKAVVAVIIGLGGDRDGLATLVGAGQLDALLSQWLVVPGGAVGGAVHVDEDTASHRG